MGVVAPAGLPRPVLAKLNAAINRAIGSAAFRQHAAGFGDEGGGGTPAEFAKLIAKESAKWAEVVRRLGARLE